MRLTPVCSLSKLQSCYIFQYTLLVNAMTSTMNLSDLVLKTHRSAEDYLFVSPRVPTVRDNKSAPPPDPPRQQKPTSPNKLPLLPQSQNLQAIITTQQRHSIIASLNGRLLYTAADLVRCRLMTCKYMYLFSICGGSLP